MPLPVSKRAQGPSYMEIGPAVSEIRQACAELGDEPHRSPFFLIVGAGISYPPVPLAPTIVEHCKTVAAKYARQAGGRPGRLDTYSDWFGLAYPGARQRQLYLRSLIEQKPLSFASLRLAHLLAARRLTNLVVTTNFDDFIARAFRLFGVEPSVCDHMRTVGRIDRERSDVQIVHVHGSYLFYDLANLRGEIAERAREDKDTSFTMMGLLDNVLWTRSPLVIGYSGWEGDIVMGALQRRLRGGNPLAQSIYWFCYRRSEIKSLPTWLRRSSDVRFVVPKERSPLPPTPSRGASPDLPSGADGATEPTLSANEVFDQLNQMFEVGPPAIFQNPIRHFAHTLQTALPEVSGTGEDPYGFKGLIDRLLTAADGFETAPPSRGPSDPLEDLRKLMRESQYEQALTLLSDIVPARLGTFESSARKEIIGAAGLVSTALLSKETTTPRPELARIAVFDPAIERMIGETPERFVWCIGSRANQYGYELSVGPEPHGAFTVQFAKALRAAASDLDGDGRISLLEAAIDTARRLAEPASSRPYAPFPQSPVVVGDAERVALFRTRRSKVREYSTLHVLIVGVGKYAGDQWSLMGPANDAKLMSELLKTGANRLYREAAVTILTDKAATRDAFQAKVKRLVTSTSPNDLAFIYFSGRGTKPTETGSLNGSEAIVLVMHEYTMDGTRGLVSTKTLAEWLAPARARHVVVVLDF